MLASVGRSAKWIVFKCLWRGLSETARRNVQNSTREIIKDITEVSTSPLLPEIQLHLITPRCHLWRSTPELCPVPDPYWAFFWPGGQVLTRYLLDNPDLVDEKVVLDVGSGAGASTIAALLSGARMVVANDVDVVAVTAIQMNLELNAPNFPDGIVGICDRYHLSKKDILPVTKPVQNQPLEDQFSSLQPLYQEMHRLRKAFANPKSRVWTCESPLGINLDVVLVGDLFYDEEIADRLFSLMHAVKVVSPATKVLIGDPGRHFLRRCEALNRFLHVAACYELPKECVEENYGFSTGYVYDFRL